MYIRNKKLIHNINTKKNLSSVQTRALGHVTDIVTRPLVQTFYERFSSNKLRIDYLKNQITKLKKEIEESSL